MNLRNDPYFSRLPDRELLAERVDPVRWGDSPGPLTAEQVNHFTQDGFVVLPDVFGPAQVHEMHQAALGLAEQLAGTERDDVITEPGSDVIRSIFRVHRDAGRFAAIAADERLAGAARQLLGSDVYIHQSRINFKPGFDGRKFDWHSDFETWHVEDGMPRMRALSASVLLTENVETNGPLMLVPRSHRTYVRCAGETPEDHFRESLQEQRYGVPSNDALDRLIERGGIRLALGNPGSVVLFDCNTLHASSGNLTPYPRHNVFLVYNSVENALVHPFGGTEPRPDFLAERDVTPV